MRPSKIAIAVMALVAVLATASTAVAATKPSVSTGGTTKLTYGSVELHGAVNPQGTSTSYYFQYGTSIAYGAQTGPATAGGGKSSVAAKADVVGLKADTKYHFRLVAINLGGTTLGGDKTFTTPKQPLGLNLSANPNPAPFGGSTTISATLTGSDSANRTIVLEGRPFPYSSAFTQVGSPAVTNSAGVATFPILALSANTQYEAVVSGTKTVSPVLSVGSAVTVHIAVSTKHPHAGSSVLFQGTVSPNEDGALYSVQRLKGTQWVSITGSSLHHHSATLSSYVIHVHVAHSGQYRVYVGVATGAQTSNASVAETFKVLPRKK